MLHSNCFLVLASVYIKHFRIFGCRCRVLPCLWLILRNWERVMEKKHIRGQGRMPHSRAEAFVVQWAHCFWEFERGGGGKGRAGYLRQEIAIASQTGFCCLAFHLLCLYPVSPVAAAATRCCQLQWGNMGFQVRLSVTLIKHIYLKAIFSRPTSRKKNSRANNWK